MARGIAFFANEAFLSNLTVFGTEGGQVFRKTVVDSIVNHFGISRASANTHYNNALQQAKLHCPAMVEGLGRAPNKIGGRPPKVTVNVIKSSTGEIVATGVSRNMANMMIERAQLRKHAKLAIAPSATETVETPAVTVSDTVVVDAETDAVAA